jgi:aminopeptidase N
MPTVSRSASSPPAANASAARYALDSAIALLRYYVDYFGARYQMPSSI